MSRRRRIALWFLLAPLAWWLLTVLAIVMWSQRSEDARADAIVVLGAAQYAGRPSPVLRARLDHAVELWNRGLAPRLLLTGGRGIGDTLSEAAAGSRYATRRGVPANAILLEATGRTTQASMRGAADVLRSNGHNSPRVLLVSDPFHMLRLTMLARLNGMTPLASPTRTSPISASPGLALEYVLRESLAIPADVGVALWAAAMKLIASPDSTHSGSTR